MAQTSCGHQVQDPGATLSTDPRLWTPSRKASQENVLRQTRSRDPQPKTSPKPSTDQVQTSLGITPSAWCPGAGWAAKDSDPLLEDRGRRSDLRLGAEGEEASGDLRIVSEEGGIIVGEEQGVWGGLEAEPRRRISGRFRLWQLLQPDTLLGVTGNPSRACQS